ncbi:pyrimidine dimer DNA glycosylase/endonuclease V [Thermoproteus tenax]|uniref:Pyrimidine dimer DNA glycosylase, T4 endoV family n=1 Tax=Thermoproteus tenax (strain ATCC 35583 / DSM 2078 / JCM 9277 / NBRC 100435 / Kra 1) TaxID=768679 RepID=G4RKY6_THETK|nr:pyrimidine dimer DNA glycosylase/endonuclease V [Thermoproteus tenax]CCC82231.1 Pyrimidine dimer DNA glycosylase, T4 endoV family [Thermoproteus tenax Kra 1]
MQIFRPYIDWSRSAGVLDDKRLGKQRVEAKQVILAILRRLGVLQDGRRGWLNHPIVLLYYNRGIPYIEDLIGFFHATVEEWVRRGHQNNISLDDIESLLSRVPRAKGTPITHVHEVEYRRVLLLKDPCHYLRKFSKEEVEEVVESEPVPLKGINTWIFDVYEQYGEFVRRLKSGDIDCRPIFPRRI